MVVAFAVAAAALKWIKGPQADNRPVKRMLGEGRAFRKSDGLISGVDLVHRGRRGVLFACSCRGLSVHREPCAGDPVHAYVHHTQTHTHAMCMETPPPPQYTPIRCPDPSENRSCNPSVASWYCVILEKSFPLRCSLSASVK